MVETHKNILLEVSGPTAVASGSSYISTAATFAGPHTSGLQVALFRLEDQCHFEKSSVLKTELHGLTLSKHIEIVHLPPPLE